eukprot:gene13807-biopygen3546
MASGITELASRAQRLVHLPGSVVLYGTLHPPPQVRGFWWMATPTADRIWQLSPRIPYDRHMPLLEGGRPALQPGMRGASLPRDFCR